MTLYQGNNLKLSLLILRAQTGDHQAFTALYEQFKLASYRYVFSLLSQYDAEVDDINQQIWLKVYQHLSKLQSPYGFTRWLMTIAHREVIAYSRKHRLLLDDSIDASGEIQQTEVVAEIDNLIKDYSWLKGAIEGCLLYTSPSPRDS